MESIISYAIVPVKDLWGLQDVIRVCNVHFCIFKNGAWPRSSSALNIHPPDWMVLQGPLGLRTMSIWLGRFLCQDAFFTLTTLPNILRIFFS